MDLRNATSRDLGERALSLTPEEVRRYARHLSLPRVGAEGQGRLKSARVLVVGAGGLGSPLALYLTAAGVGTIGLVDFDVVEESNLHRQLLYETSDVGHPKVEAARSRLHGVNPHVRIESFGERLSAANALAIVSRFDVLADGTDNFATRYLVNDACVLTGRPNVHAAVFQFEGQASVFWAEKGPCYRCVHPEPPPAGAVPSCEEAGVLGILPGVMGLLQATEVIKLILGEGETLIGRLLSFDALAMRFHETRLRKDPDCAVCGAWPTVRSLIDYEAFCGNLSAMRPGVPEISVEELQALRDRGEEMVLLDVREPHEFAISDLPGSVKMPLATLPQAFERLLGDKDKDIVVYCRVGGRSARAVEYLTEMGFGRVRNLAGGINRWAERIDPKMARY